ncbi:unnamed protein product [Ectocarpus sp. 13 AM-2016]
MWRREMQKWSGLLLLLLFTCLVSEVVIAVDSDDDDLIMANGAAVNMAIIFGLSGGLLLLLYILLKYVERVDKHVQEEIDDLRRKRAASKDMFRELNGYTWDYVMVFEVRAEDKELTSYQRKFSMKEILTRLNAGGIGTRMFYSVQRDEVYCKIRCPLERLQREADRVGYKILLDANNLRSTCQHGRPGKWASIVIQDEYNESPYEAYEYIYAPYTVDRPELESLYKKHGGLERDVVMIPFRGTDRLKLLYSILVAKTADSGCNLDILRLVKSKCLLAFFPLHDKVELRALQRKWLQYFRPPWKEPIDDVKNYFGEKIGLYFLWLGHYTTWLIPASIVGVMAWVHVALSGNDPNALGSALFSIFIGLWTTLFTEFWKRKQARCAMRWGMSGFEEQEQTRPQYKGIRSSSTIDGKPMDYFPPSESRKRFIFSQTVILGLILVVIGVVASIFWLKYFLTQASPAQSSALDVWGVSFATIIPPLVNAVQIQVMNAFYGTVAIKLTDLENHRTDTEYEDNLIAKTFMFQFVNSYASLVYIAFIKEFIGSPCLVSCMNELSTNLSTVFLARLAVGNLSEVVLPILKARRRQREETMGSDPERTFSGPEREYIKETYDVMLGTFKDYAEMIIQFGYATLFVAAYPLSCLMALVNNYIEIRIDAWKLCQVSRRPEPRGAEDIGTWHTILTIMSSMAVVSNSAIVAFTSEIFHDQTWTTRVWIFLGIEHGMLLFKYLLETLINDTPADVGIQLKRNEFIVSKVVYNMPDDDDEEAVRAGMPTLSDHTILSSDD